MVNEHINEFIMNITKIYCYFDYLHRYLEASIHTGLIDTNIEHAIVILGTHIGFELWHKNWFSDIHENVTF